MVYYKTDGLLSSYSLNDRYFIDKYKVQLDIYRQAISDITGIKVDKSYIYSFKLDKAIIL